MLVNLQWEMSEFKDLLKVQFDKWLSNKSAFGNQSWNTYGFEMLEDTMLIIRMWEMFKSGDTVKEYSDSLTNTRAIQTKDPHASHFSIPSPRYINWGVANKKKREVLLKIAFTSVILKTRAVNTPSWSESLRVICQTLGTWGCRAATQLFSRPSLVKALTRAHQVSPKLIICRHLINQCMSKNIYKISLENIQNMFQVFVQQRRKISTNIG